MKKSQESGTYNLEFSASNPESKTVWIPLRWAKNTTCHLIKRYVVVACVNAYQLTLAFNDQSQKKWQQKLKQHNFHFFEIAVN